MQDHEHSYMHAHGMAHSHGHVHENYCPNTGEGCNVKNSDRFYHWGGLLAYIAIDHDETANKK